MINNQNNKTMDKYKELYEETIATIKDFYQYDADSETAKRLEVLFPQLRESEDEKIRKELIYFIQKEKEYVESQVKPENSPKLRFLIDSLSWLEKQSEQNPTDKVEQKFKVGDWIVNNNGEPRVFRVEKQGWPDCIISSSLGNQFINTFTLDKQYHLWTIQDAKDGDVLCCDNWNNKTIYLFKEQRGSTDIANAYFQIFNENNETKLMFNKAADFNLSTKPATKEQRDLLFQKMKEAGYEWDAEKKELKKIEQKPAWSEEDERHRKRIVERLEDIRKSKEDNIDIASVILSEINWLKSIKERYTWKPSDEQISMLTRVCSGLHLRASMDANDMDKFLDELKKIA